MLPVKSNADSISIEEYAKAPFGNVLFIRHTLAPGFGDPANFMIEDCLTQRNLNAEGKRQAEKIGKLFKRKGLRFTKIFSSEWCRCKETASLIDLGDVIPLKSLNSFYQNIVPKDKTLEALRLDLHSLEKTSGITLMVTHYVTILAITGIPISSGGAVAYHYKTNTAKELIY